MYWELSIQQEKETPVYVVHPILGATTTKISHLLSLKKKQHMKVQFSHPKWSVILSFPQFSHENREYFSVLNPRPL